MRLPLLLLLLPACDPTIDPDPPTALPYTATAFSVANTHTMIVTPFDPVTGGDNVKVAGTDVPRHVDDNGDPVPLGLPVMTAVAVGRVHACGISATGSVHCWGDQTHAALGMHRVCTPPAAEGGVPDCTLGPAIMPSLPPVRALVAGDDVTCAIMKDDHVVCWGVPGRTGGSLLPALDPPTPVTLTDGAVLSAARLIASHGSICAIDHDARLWCWGDGFATLPQLQPQRGVTDIALGRRHRCIIDEDGLSCWGDDRNGEIGDIEFARACGDDCQITTPHHIDLDAYRVVVGERHTCALDHAGVVTCWGSNEVGQLGRTDAFLVGDLGFALDTVSDLAAGYAHTCALRNGNAVWCWGSTSALDPSETTTP